MLDFKIISGSRRLVFLIGRRVYKVPSFKSWVSFIRGIEENLEERYWWSADGSRKRNPNQPWDYHLPLAEIFWADRFGFLLIMERLDTSFIGDDGNVIPEFKDRFEHDFESLKEVTKAFQFHSDIKIANVGYRGDRLLVLDYGYYGGTMDCYIGT